MTSPQTPQLFIRSDHCQSPQLLTESGFWAPSLAQTHRLSLGAEGYYRPLIDGSYWTIGRSSSCSITLPERTISRQHALLISTANRDFFVTDLASRNGSFVNGKPVAEPQRLCDGDYLRMGKIEIEFQFPKKVPHGYGGEQRQRRILMIQPSVTQGKIWQEILTCQHIVFAWEQVADNLKETIRRLAAKATEFPDLLMVDIAALQSETYGFCRWCAEHYPDLKVILTYASRTEILDVEQEWAIKQGAFAVFSAFDENRLLANMVDTVTKVNCILQALKQEPVQESSLASVLLLVSRYALGKDSSGLSSEE
jgi:CheY-like chemotaxis protein